jgi:uncharacterized protein (TIGR00304 family)
VVNSEVLYTLGLALVFFGVAIIIIAVVLLSVSGGRKGKIKSGCAILIGPIPIVFGTNKKSLKAVLLLSLALTAMVVVAMVVYHLLLR